MKHAELAQQQTLYFAIRLVILLSLLASIA